MRIGIGTKNPVKVQAIKEVFQSYPEFSEAIFEPKSVNSGIPEQPLSLEEILLGAYNRARNSFSGCDYSIGVEGGLMSTGIGYGTGHLNVTVCVVFDGKRTYIGSGPGFELPFTVLSYILQDGLTLDEAMLKAGLTESQRVGYEEGGNTAIITNNRRTKKEDVQVAVMFAISSYLLRQKLEKKKILE